MIAARLLILTDKLALLNAPGSRWVLVTLLVCAAVGAWFYIKECLSRQYRMANKAVILCLMSVMLLILYLCVPGAIVLFAETRMDARNLLGFGTVSVLIFYLAHGALIRLHPSAGLLLAIPCCYMLSLSFMYGQVLREKRDMEVHLSNNIGYDLTSRADFEHIEHFAIMPPQNSTEAQWVPGAENTIALVPVLGYILSSDNAIVWPDRFRHLGIDKVAWTSRAVEHLITENKARVVVDNKQYRIYLVGNQGVIQIKRHDVLAPP